MKCGNIPTVPPLVILRNGFPYVYTPLEIQIYILYYFDDVLYYHKIKSFEYISLF